MCALVHFGSFCLLYLVIFPGSGACRYSHLARLHFRSIAWPGSATKGRQRPLHARAGGSIEVRVVRIVFSRCRYFRMCRIAKSIPAAKRPPSLRLCFLRGRMSVRPPAVNAKTAQIVILYSKYKCRRVSRVKTLSFREQGVGVRLSSRAARCRQIGREEVEHFPPTNFFFCRALFSSCLTATAQ